MTAPADDIRHEAQRLTEAALAKRLPIRLMGGCAVWLRCPSARVAPYARPYADLDFAASRRQAQGVAEFFTAAGYEPEKLFNALHGARRLNFRHPEGRWTIDVLFDELDMSHKIDLRGRLEGPGPTVELADLLAMKLQIWEINEKDLGDIVCLLADHPLDGPDREAIETGRLTGLASADWGLCHTIERNLERAAGLAVERPPLDSPFDPVDQAHALLAAIEAAPKSLAWRMRARVGERVRWYETPEEVRHDA